MFCRLYLSTLQMIDLNFELGALPIPASMVEYVNKHLKSSTVNVKIQDIRVQFATQVLISIAAFTILLVSYISSTYSNLWKYIQ